MTTEYCQRCLPDKLVKAMGFIPMPEMSNTGDTRENERRILLCRIHYFEAKKNCFYVVPFNRDDDPVDSFLSRVNQKHKLIRGSLKMKFGSDKHPKGKIEDEQKPTNLRTYVEPTKIVRPQQNNKNYNHKVHYLEANQTTCGLPAASVLWTTDEDRLTCKNCISSLSAAELKREPDLRDPIIMR